MKDTESRIIKSILKGDTQAFELLFDAYQKQVYLTCLKFMKTDHDARDMAQEVFIKIYNKLDTFKLKSKFSTWVYTLCASTCLDEMRKQKRIQRQLTSQDVPIPATLGKPEEMLESKTLMELILGEVENNTAKTAEVMKRRLFNEEPYEKIAEMIDIPASSARTFFTRGRKRLMKSIQTYNKED